MVAYSKQVSLLFAEAIQINQLPQLGPVWISLLVQASS